MTSFVRAWDSSPSINQAHTPSFSFFKPKKKWMKVSCKWMKSHLHEKREEGY